MSVNVLRTATGSHIKIPGGYFQIRRSGGGVDLTSNLELEAKFGARSGQVHQIRGKIWEFLSPQDAKVGKSPNFGVIPEIQRAKFGVFVIYIFGGKIWGQAPPRPTTLEVPPPWIKISPSSFHVFGVRLEFEIQFLFAFSSFIFQPHVN